MTSPTCVVVDGGDTYAGAQGFDYFAGISAQTAGAQGLCMHRLVIPPGAAARPHLHEDHETAIFVLSGGAEMHWGEGLREHVAVRAGQFLYIPAGMPHRPFNPGDEPCVALLARTDPNEQESVVLLDDEGRRREDEPAAR